jgi:hypothetical protein
VALIVVRFLEISEAWLGESTRQQQADANRNIIKQAIVSLTGELRKVPNSRRRIDRFATNPGRRS